MLELELVLELAIECLLNDNFSFLNSLITVLDITSQAKAQQLSTTPNILHTLPAELEVDIMNQLLD